MKRFRFGIQGQKFQVEVTQKDEKFLTVEVNGTAYEVELDREIKTTKTPVLVRSAMPQGSPIPPASDRNTIAITSPLPGIVLSMAVKEGDTIHKGQVLFVLEAMKMENSIQSDYDGVVAKVLTQPGAQVLQGATLIEIKA
jgi:biotin carboxyl carrier protein